MSDKPRVFGYTLKIDAKAWRTEELRASAVQALYSNFPRWLEQNHPGVRVGDLVDGPTSFSKAVEVEEQPDWASPEDGPPWFEMLPATEEDATLVMISVEAMEVLDG